MTLWRLVGAGAGLVLVLAGCGEGLASGEPSPTLSLDFEKMEKGRIEASQRAEARASASAAASASASATAAGPYVWKEIPEPTMPPEALVQAGFAEAELAAKYFVELQYYVAQTNDLTTWEQVIHPDSPSGKQVIENTHKRQADGVRLIYSTLTVSPIRAEQNADRPEIYRVYLTFETEGETAIDSTGKAVDDNGARFYYVTSHIERQDNTWVLIDSDFETERPEEW